MSWVTNTIVRPLVAHLVEDVEALLLEGRVADGEHLVDEQDLGVDLDRDREREPHVHPRGVVLELQLLELAQFGEVDHGVVAGARLAWREPHHDPVEHDVVARREVLVEADAELDERRQSPVHPDPPAVDAVDAGEALQQRALAAAVAPGDAEELAAAHVEGDVVQRAGRSRGPLRRSGCSARSLSVCVRSSGTRKVFVTAVYDDRRRGAAGRFGHRCKRIVRLLGPSRVDWLPRYHCPAVNESFRASDARSETTDRRRACSSSWRRGCVRMPAVASPLAIVASRPSRLSTPCEAISGISTPRMICASCRSPPADVSPAG